MRPTRLTTKLSANALGLAFGLALLALPAPARAADDDVPIDTKIIRGFLETLGLKQDGEAMINYEERAPLVLPPGHDLPPPEKADAAARNPAWPNDPDITRRKAQIALEKNRNVSEERERESTHLLPDELAPGAKSNPRLARRKSNAPGAGEEKLSPSQLGYTGNLFSTMFSGKDNSNVATFTGEKPRVSLTDPPPGYQVPSPDQPYGLGKESIKSRPTNFAVTHGEVQDGR